jgi:predicted transcriptional regulator
MELRLSQAELEVMEELWKRGRLSIREIQESFPEAARPPYTSVQTIVYRLEEKGVVQRVRKIGNAHIFDAIASRQDISSRFIDDLLTLFGGRAQTVMAHFVESGKLTRADIRETEKLIDDLEGNDERRKGKRR